MSKVQFLKLVFLCLLSPKILGAEFQLMGSYLLEYSIFKIDIYEISYFKSINAEKLVLAYKTTVKKEHSQAGWRLGLKHRLAEDLFQPKVQWLLDHTVDVEAGDRLVISRQNDKLEIYKNEQLVAKTEDKIIAELAFEPWLGSKPISAELKASLLGVGSI